MEADVPVLADDNFHTQTTSPIEELARIEEVAATGEVVWTGEGKSNVELVKS